jgi:hypothetical protein
MMETNASPLLITTTAKNDGNSPSLFDAPVRIHRILGQIAEVWLDYALRTTFDVQKLAVLVLPTEYSTCQPRLSD